MPKPTLPLTDSQCKKLEAPSSYQMAAAYIYKQEITANIGIFVITDQATTNTMKCNWVSILKSA